MQKLSTYGQQIDQIDINAPKKSGFDRTSHNYGTAKIGKIIPTRMNYLQPGDRIKGSESYNIQFEPLSVPIMADMHYKSEHIIMPLRLLWSGFKKFYSGKQQTEFPTYSLSQIVQLFINDGTFPYFNVLKEYSDISERPPFEDFKDRISNYLNDFELQNLDLYYPIFDLYDKHYKQFAQLYVDLITTYFESPFASGSVSDYTLQSVETLLRTGSVGSLRTLLQTITTDLTNTPMTSQLLNMSIVKDLICKYGRVLNYGFEFSCDVFEYMFGASSLFDYLRCFKIDTITWKNSANDFISAYYDKTRKNAISLGNLGNAIDYVFANGFPIPNYNTTTTGNERYKQVLLACFINKFEVQTYNVIGSSVPAPTIKVQYFDGSLQFNWLPFRANYWSWYYLYRDRLIETGHIDPEDYVSNMVEDKEVYEMIFVRPRCWSKDTFTTALENTGSGNVYVPSDIQHSATQLQKLTIDDEVGGNEITDTFALNGVVYKLPSKYLSSSNFDSENLSETANLISVDNINRAKRLARFLQKELLLSNDYQDVIYSHWAVHVSDKTLQRPEWIDGNNSLIRIDTIVNNTTVENTIAGDKGAIAYGNSKSDGYNVFIEEPSIEICYFSVMPYQSYPFGVDRFYMYRDRFDLPWAEFADLGLQAVYNYEIQVPNGQYVQPDNTDVDWVKRAFDVFGYQGRYYERKTQWDEVHGRITTDMRDYVFGRYFNYMDVDNMPKLNYIFLHCHPDLSMFVLDDETLDMFHYDIVHSQASETELPVSSTEIY